MGSAEIVTAALANRTRTLRAWLRTVTFIPTQEKENG